MAISDRNADNYGIRLTEPVRHYDCPDCGKGMTYDEIEAVCPDCGIAIDTFGEEIIIGSGEYHHEVSGAIRGTKMYYSEDGRDGITPNGKRSNASKLVINNIRYNYDCKRAGKHKNHKIKGNIFVMKSLCDEFNIPVISKVAQTAFFYYEEFVYGPEMRNGINHNAVMATAFRAACVNFNVGCPRKKVIGFLGISNNEFKKMKTRMTSYLKNSLDIGVTPYANPVGYLPFIDKSLGLGDNSPEMIGAREILGKLYDDQMLRAEYVTMNPIQVAAAALTISHRRMCRKKKDGFVNKVLRAAEKVCPCGTVANMTHDKHYKSILKDLEIEIPA
jgi:transcription initiation factor TFIIIB Brf1 subunit/transcription initiation factor TFIIB